jgi:hypothetical protein
MSGFFVSAMAALIIGQPSSSAPIGRIDPRCGSKCVFVGLRALDMGPARLAEIEHTLGAPGPLGYSVLQLSQVAEAAGAHTVAVKTSLDNLSQRSRTESFVCLTIMSGSHFVLLYDIDQSNIWLIDPPRKLVLPRETFINKWSKEALLISRQPLAREESIGSSVVWWRRSLATLGVLLSIAVVTVTALRRRRYRNTLALCSTMIWFVTGCDVARRPPTRSGSATSKFGGRIELSESRVALGRIKLSTAVQFTEAETSIRNVGQETLQIGEITFGCNCTSARVTDVLVAPGRRTTLTTRIKVGNLPGPRSATIVLHTSDSLEPEKQISFEWEVINRLQTLPAALDFGRVIPREGRAAELQVLGSSLRLCPDCSVRAGSNSPLIHCVLFPQAPQVVRHDKTESDLQIPLASVKVEILPSTDEAFFHQQVTLSVWCGNRERARAEVPMSWRVGRLLEVSPKQVWLGSRAEGEQTTTSVLLHSPLAIPFRVLDVRAENPSVAVEAQFDSSPSATQRLRLRIRTPRKSGPWATWVEIQTDHAGATTIPLSISAIVHR